MGRKKWIVPAIDKKRAADISEKYNIDPVTASLLVSRGLDGEDGIREFCFDDGELCDPFLLKDMDKAVRTINESLENGEKITVYGDYDADGVTSTAIMFSFLEMQGADVDFYIPNRNTEGYGMNPEAVRKIAGRGTKLIVTVDNGISAFYESELIYELGMKLVITDHHKVQDRLPVAEAVVNPHRPDNPLTFDDWSGAGVAFKTVCALSVYEDTGALLEEFSDIAAIGTIGDVVPLTGENRLIVKHGISMINRTQREGLRSLIRLSSGEKTVGSSAVTFTLVPRLNAIGRMGNAEKAVRLLITDDDYEADLIAQELCNLNTERQKTENEIIAEAMAQINDDPSMLYDRVLIFHGENWHSGVIGIVASRFVDKYGKPCIVITSDGKEAKGSGRSLEGFSLYDAIDSASHLLTHFGGHVLAAGFGLAAENIGQFKHIVNDYAKHTQMPYPTVKMDFRLRPEAVSSDILEVFDGLEPFGAGNPRPLFALYNLKIENITPVGGGKHLKITLSTGNTSITAMKFSTTLREFYYKKGDTVDIAARLERNEYLGEVRVSIHIAEIKDAFTSDDKCLYGRRIFEKIMRKEQLLPKERELALPSREDAAAVYRYVKQNVSVPYDFDLMCFRLGDDGEKYCKFTVASEALTELGVLTRDTDGFIRLSENQSKVNLSSSELLRRIEENI